MLLQVGPFLPSAESCDQNWSFPGGLPQNGRVKRSFWSENAVSVSQLDFFNCTDGVPQDEVSGFCWPMLLGAAPTGQLYILMNSLVHSRASLRSKLLVSIRVDAVHHGRDLRMPPCEEPQIPLLISSDWQPWFVNWCTPSLKVLSQLPVSTCAA